MIRYLASLWYRLRGRPVCVRCGPVAAWKRVRQVGVGHDGRPIQFCSDCREVRLVARSGRRIAQ